MSDIASIGHTNGIHSITGSSSTGPVSRLESSSLMGKTAERIPDEALRSRDRVEISEHAVLLDRLLQMPDVRMDRVEAIREAIAQGTFETPERLDGAIEGLIADLMA